MGRNHKTDPGLSRRERQIMDIVIPRGRMTATQVREALPDPPSYSAVRALLRVLEDKGHLVHDTEGTRFVYRPTRSLHHARRAALHHLVHTYFGGSALRAIEAALELDDVALGDKTREALRTALTRAQTEEPAAS